jgi:hypothetical protein
MGHPLGKTPVLLMRGKSSLTDIRNEYELNLVLSLVQTNLLRLSCSFSEFSVSEVETSGLKWKTERA